MFNSTMGIIDEENHVLDAEKKKLLILRPANCTFTLIGSVAEWSKALVLGTSLSGRGFESHRCQ